MSDYLRAGKTYKIENTWFQGVYVSRENLAEGPITGNRFTHGGIQTWQLIYKDGFVAFLAVSPTFETKGWIYVDEAGTGLYYARGDNPTKFILERVDSERQDTFIVKPVRENNSQRPSPAWMLPSGGDGTQVAVSIIGLEGFTWRFIEYTKGKD